MRKAQLLKQEIWLKAFGWNQEAKYLVITPREKIYKLESWILARRGIKADINWKEDVHGG